MLPVQPASLKAVKARHRMNEETIAVCKIIHFNHASLKYKTFSVVYNESERTKRLLFSIRVDS